MLCARGFTDLNLAPVSSTKALSNVISFIHFLLDRILWLRDEKMTFFVCVFEYVLQLSLADFLIQTENFSQG